MKDRKRGTMGLMPAPAPAAILGIKEFQRHDCVATRLEHAVALSDILTE